jgi:serine/threonine protein kinase
MAPPDVPFLEDHFTLGEEVGRGGMMTVHRATGADGAEAVVKLFLHTPEEVELRRMGREAGALAGLDHPALARLIGVYRTRQGQPCIVYEYCPGVTLLQWAGQRPRSTVELLSVLRPLAEGLDHCRAEGLAFRDAKPENVVVDEADQPRLVDFGLVLGTEDTRHTETGHVVGTPHYMAPEVLAGQRPGPAADVYALAVMAHELLAGSLPFTGSPATVATAHLNQPPPPLPTTRDPHGYLSRVLARGMAKAPEERPSTALALVRDLEEAAARPEPPATPRGGRTRPLDEAGGSPEALPATSVADRPPAGARTTGQRGGRRLLVVLAGITLVAGAWWVRSSQPQTPAPVAGSTAVMRLVATEQALRGALLPGVSTWPAAPPGSPGGLTAEDAGRRMLEPAFASAWSEHLAALRAWLEAGPAPRAGDCSRGPAPPPAGPS